MLAFYFCIVSYTHLIYAESRKRRIMPSGLRAHRLHLYVLFWQHSNSVVTTLKYWRAYILCCHVINLIQRVTLDVAILFKVRVWSWS